MGASSQINAVSNFTLSMCDVEMQVNSVAFSADGSRIVSGSGDKSIRVWDSGKGAQVRALENHDSAVRIVWGLCECDLVLASR